MSLIITAQPRTTRTTDVSAARRSGRTPSLVFFLRHEMRLAWREGLAVMAAGRPQRIKWAIALLLVFAAIAHLIAFTIVGRHAQIETTDDRGTLVVITGCVVLACSLMLSQAMESVTRAFYARADLDLILSSPAAAQRAFAVRIAILSAATIVMAVLIAAPFIDVLIWRGGIRWIAAYATAIAVGAMAVSVAVALTVVLFRLIGPARTRLVSQVVAAVIGAMFVIGLQLGAVVSYGTLSQLSFLQSPWLLNLVPPADSLAWWPARAILGEPRPLAATLALGVAMLVASITIFSRRFGDHALAASSSAAEPARREPQARHAFVRRSAKGMLRRKEWVLLRRDPWLMSQTLMQLLYLLPPALMLWTAFGKGNDDVILLVPVLVMAAGQLAGGLAWLAISGEDAPELVATAPVPSHFVIRAKVEAVTFAVAAIFAPFLLAMALVSPRDGLAALLGVATAAIGATLIQLWFRTQSRRKHFNRRQTSSRIATFAEAFSSISWAGAAGLAAAGYWQAVIVALIALAILGAARLLSPARV